MVECRIVRSSGRDWSLLKLERSAMRICWQQSLQNWESEQRVNNLVVRDLKFIRNLGKIAARRSGGSLKFQSSMVKMPLAGHIDWRGFLISREKKMVRRCRLHCLPWKVEP